MNKKFKYLYILLLLVVVSSCKDYLNNTPKGITIPLYMEDYQKLMNSQSLINSSNGNLEYLTDNIHLLDKTSSAAYYIYLNKGESERNLYSFKPGQVYVEGAKDYTWNSAYSRLYTFNSVINAVMGSQGGTEKGKLTIQAEALFARAYEFYNLVNTYSKQYDIKTADKDLGVPYLKDANINQGYDRHTVAQVYKYMLEDLKEAEPNIPSIAANKAHPNKTALYSFYARIYLTMGDYTKALKYANDALALNNNLLNLNNYEKAEGTTWGRVYLKGNPAQRMPDIDHPEANYVKWLSGGLQGNVMLSRDMRDVYAKDLNGAKDLRKEYFFAEDKADLGGSPNYFPGECAFVLYSYFNIGFSSTENYFIAAECEARIGSKDRAMQLINTVRANRLDSAINLTAANKDEALIKVLEEKRREFCFKGPMRLFDLKRLNLEPALQKTVTHTADGETFTLPPNDIRYVFPVNQEILDFNPNFPIYER